MSALRAHTRPPMQNIKPCSVCGINKPLNQFTHARKVRHHRCLECERERTKRRRNDGSLGRVSARYRSHHPKAVEAHRLVHQAIKRGLLQRLPCCLCGLPKSEAHHEDYSKPFDLVWLCVRHHQDRHIHLRNAKTLGQEPMPINYFIKSLQVTACLAP